MQLTAAKNKPCAHLPGIVLLNMLIALEDAVALQELLSLMRFEIAPR